MKQPKRIVSIFLAVLMLVCAVPIANIAITASAISRNEFDAKLAEVRSMYPQGSQRTSWPKGSTCHGYARWISEYVWGSDFANGRGTGWTQIKATSSYSYVDSIRTGDVIRFRRAEKSWNHTIFITDVSDTTLTYTDCNSDGASTIKWNQTMSKSAMDTALKLALYDSSNETATYGYIAQYQDKVETTPTSAPTRAVVKTNGYSYAVDERVYFTFDCDGTVNNLWIYCPNGQTLTYKDVGTEYDLGFGMSGEFEALVQTWNSIGSKTSERIHFLVGNPTRSILKTDHTSYEVDETVTFTCDTNGTPNCNVIWIYCPNGETKHYSDIGTSMKIGFGMKGEYEALVQAWSGTGSLRSEKIKFVIGPPTKATIKSDKSVYQIGETVTFICNTNGSENSNCVWVYGPDGKSSSYTKIGTTKTVTLNQAGRYEALVQAWNRAGSLISDRISFEVKTNHTHSYTSAVTKAETCVATGVKTFTCSCGDSYTESIPINISNHVNTTNTAATASTCTVKGYTAGVYCNDCKKYISGHAEQALAAHQTETKNQKAAICTAEGYTGDQVCTVCKQTITKGTVTAKLNHTTVLQNKKDASCTTAGYTGDQVCTMCKQTITKGTSIAKLNHTTVLQNKKDATCTAEGYTGDQVCTSCKQTITKGKPVNALGHANADSNGNCTRCGTHIKDVTPSNPQPSNTCKYCGQVHTGFFGKIIAFFHNILAAIFGKKY